MNNSEEKVIFFNRDWTLIRPKSKHFVPQEPLDWQMMPGVYDTLQNLFAEGYHLAVVTNQQGISSGRTTLELQQQINREIASHCGDQYSEQFHFFIGEKTDSPLFKPNTGALNDLAERFSVDNFNSKVVGNTLEDIQFANNANLSFVPAAKFFNWRPQLTILCGYPGSGISTHITRYHPGDFRVSLDDLIRSINREYHIEWKQIYYVVEEKMIVEALKQGSSVVIDRTNLSKKRRRRFVEMVRGAKSLSLNQDGASHIEIVCKHLDLPIDMCKERYKTGHVKTERELWEMEEFFDRMEGEFEPLEMEEGFDRLIILDKDDLTT